MQKDLQENQIICGPALEVLKTMPAESISCCVSSPPYWSLRDYGTATWEGGEPECDHIEKTGTKAINTGLGYPSNGGPRRIGENNTYGDAYTTKFKDICGKCGAKRIDKQLGLEKTFEEYIDKLCTIYDEVRRVLRPDGTVFINLGDTYWGGKGQSGQGSKEYQEARQDVSINKPASHIGGQSLTRPQDMQHETIQAKSLCLIPQRFAIEMVNRGWILRNTIIWHKPNPMPSSAKDRFTVDFEFIYFFTKQRKYWFEPQYEPYATESNAERPRMGQGNQTKYNQKRQGQTWAERKEAGEPMRHGLNGAAACKSGNYASPLGRNKRTVWTIPTQAFPDAHFATYPEKLVEPMIKAGCPEFICTKCGKAREKIFDVSYEQARTPQFRKQSDNYDKGMVGYRPKDILNKVPKFTGYTDCGCNAEFKPGVVLDPFAGSGATLQVAARLNRNYLGIELNPEYIEMAEKRVMQGESGIPVKEQKQGQQALFKE